MGVRKHRNFDSNATIAEARQTRVPEWTGPAYPPTQMCKFSPLYHPLVTCALNTPKKRISQTICRPLFTLPDLSKLVSGSNGDSGDPQTYHERKIMPSVPGLAFRIQDDELGSQVSSKSSVQGRERRSVVPALSALLLRYSDTVPGITQGPHRVRPGGHYPYGSRDDGRIHGL